jgi:hypothetical protein
MTFVELLVIIQFLIIILLAVHVFYLTKMVVELDKFARNFSFMMDKTNELIEELENEQV